MTTSARQLNDHDRELLSSYIDSALTESERQQLELRLLHEPALRQELEELQATVQALRTLSSVPLPRSFTIDLAVERKAQPWWMSLRGMLGATGAIAALFVAAWISFGMLSSSGGGGGNSSSAAAPTAEVGLASRSASETEPYPPEQTQSYAPMPAATMAAAATALPAATRAPAAAPPAVALAPVATAAPEATAAAASEVAPATAAEVAATTDSVSGAEAPPVTVTTLSSVAGDQSNAGFGTAENVAATAGTLAQRPTEAPAAKQSSEEDTTGQRQAAEPTSTSAPLVVGIALIVLAVIMALFVVRRRAS